MIEKARVFLGSNRRDWYWVCPTCKGIQKVRKSRGLTVSHLDVGGIELTCSGANDRARQHLFTKHDWKGEPW